MSFGVGVASACCAIGPLTGVALVGYDFVTSGFASRTLAAAPFALFVALPVGGFFSAIANVVGSAVLGWLGCHWAWARHPLVWMATGVLLGGSMGAAVVDQDLAPGLPLLFAGAGGVSALLCRHGTDWDA